MVQHLAQQQHLWTSAKQRPQHLWKGIYSCENFRVGAEYAQQDGALMSEYRLHLIVITFASP